MLTKITRLDKLGGFRLRVRFSDGSEGVHDFAAMVQEPVDDHGLLAEAFRELVGDDSADGVDTAAGRIGHD